MLPCAGNISKCNATEWADVQAYGPTFMEQFTPYMTQDSANGAFLDACLIHGSTSTPIDGLTNANAFQGACGSLSLCARSGVALPGHPGLTPPLTLTRTHSHTPHAPGSLAGGQLQALVDHAVRRLRDGWALRQGALLPALPPRHWPGLNGGGGGACKDPAP